MPAHEDREHFADYRAQTRVKHAILNNYLRAYFTILGRNKALLYLDAFAGRGTYDDPTGGKQDGSPLRALRLIASTEKFASIVDTVFIEVDPKLFAQLTTEIQTFASSHPGIRPPKLYSGTFAERLPDVIAQFGGALPPTFVFVDPCGVTGNSFDAIRQILQFPSCEAFIFFNIDGIRRTLGLEGINLALVELLGSHKRAAALSQQFQNESNPDGRERLVLEAYRQALNTAMGVKYTIPFRIEAEEKRKTSHYLIHATHHALGFKIMKDVMSSLGQSDMGSGVLAFEQASQLGIHNLFDLHELVIAQNILRELQSGPKPVSLFCKQWVERPEDLRLESNYKATLLNLESEQKIVVLDKDRTTPRPPSNRPKRKGKPTLGEDYWVKLA